MSDLDKPIRRARRRLRLQRFVVALVWCLTGTLALVALVIVGQKLGRYTLPGPWWASLAIGAGLAPLLAWIVSRIGGPSRLESALAIDRRFHLGERLSTALSLPDSLRETPAGRALLADARRHAEGLDIAERFGLRRPRLAWVPIVPALAVVGLAILPDALFGREAGGRRGESARAAETKKEVSQALKSVSRTLAERRERMKNQPEAAETGKVLAEVQQKLDEMSKTPPADKTQAMAELNKLAEAVQQRRREVADSEQIRRQLEQLKEFGDGSPGDELARDLARGEFQKAAQDLKKLQDKLASGKMSEAEKKELAQQLADLKNQLDKMANLEERRKQLEEARKDGRISEQQYQEQKQKLEQQARQMQALQQLADKLGAAQQQMAAGQDKQAAQSLQEAMDQVAEMAKQAEQIEALDAALADLQDGKSALSDEGMNQLGRDLEGMQGLGDFGMRPGQGNGMGRGRGRGDRPEAPDDTASHESRVRQQVTKGRAMLGGFADPAAQVRGESVLVEQGTIEAAAGVAAEALTEQRIPNAAKKHVRDYLDQVRQGE